MIEVRNISYKTAGKILLNDISFSVGSGDLLAVLGANGAGKTTLLRLLCNEYQPATGHILLDSKPLTHYSVSELARRRAVLTQHHTVSMSFVVEELVLMGRYPHFTGKPGPEDFRILRQVMAETDIQHLSGRIYNTLSGGEQQRVQLARVLAQICNVPGAYLFLDEPTSGLDLLHQQQMLALARDMARRGYCVICILHDINLASRFADKILILKEGNRVAFGDPQEVITCENIHEAYRVPVKLMEYEELRCPLVIPQI